MNIARRAAILAASLSFAFATPVLAQDAYPMDQGDFVEISAIQIDDGHTVDYLNHVTGLWRRGQEFAKSQGWITSYEVMANVHPRKGEPDVYLITRSSRMVDAAEQKKRDDAYNAHMQRTVAQLESESGERAKYRHLAGTQLLRELRFKK
jgi:hypothetical protein